MVVLHQNAEKDDEDDLQDEADERQLQPHVGAPVRHVLVRLEEELRLGKGLLLLKNPGQRIWLHAVFLTQTPGCPRCRDQLVCLRVEEAPGRTEELHVCVFV